MLKSGERVLRSRQHERGTSQERRYKRSHRRSPSSRQQSHASHHHRERDRERVKEGLAPLSGSSASMSSSKRNRHTRHQASSTPPSEHSRHNRHRSPVSRSPVSSRVLKTLKFFELFLSVSKFLSLMRRRFSYSFLLLSTSILLLFSFFLLR